MIKLPEYTTQDTTIKMVVLPIFIFIENAILIGPAYYHSWPLFVQASLILLVSMHIHWYVNNGITLSFHHLFPLPQQYLKRVFLCHPTLMLNSSLFTWAAYKCYDLFNLSGFSANPTRLAWGLGFVVLTVLIVGTVYEGINAFEQWTTTLRETEQLKKANLQTQFAGLKSQINPHFLFNSLNTLSSLIEEDAEQAEEFVEEMSSVYRYLLRSNETQLVKLSDEIAFARSYFHLLRTRYGDNIRLEQAVDAAHHDQLLPPLTLQLLLENAVKHNVILPQKPLLIRVETIPAPAAGEGVHKLIIRNNLQRKTGRVMSNQIGLANIATQYRLLGGGEVVVLDDEQFFTVTLPLIQPN